MQGRSEREITIAIAEMGSRDSQFAVALARSLLGTVLEGDGPTAGRAQRLLRHVPRSRMDLLTEKHVPHDRLRDIWRRVHRSRIDWLFLGDMFALAVEVKTRRSTGFGDLQLDSYHRALATRGSPIARPYSGLLALTPVPPFRDELISIRRRKRFLGAILWADAGYKLRLIAPRDPSASSGMAARAQASTSVSRSSLRHMG
jgi:hypothetical protein